eukprot:3446792-Rhodomonas_salina.3
MDMLGTILEGDSDATSPQGSTPYQGVTLGTQRSAYPSLSQWPGFWTATCCSRHARPQHARLDQDRGARDGWRH